MASLFWVGPRESDIAYTGDLFQGSATFYGSNINTNSTFCDGTVQRINHNEFGQEASDFILRWQLEQIDKSPDCRFMSYNPNCVFGAPEEIVSRTLCLNEEHLMRHLDDKLAFRKIAGDAVPLLKTKRCKGSECIYERLIHDDMFDGYTALVVQELVSSGGQGTYLMTKESASSVFECLNKDNYYIVSGYFTENIPINIHAVIYDDGIHMLPPSIQIIQHGHYRLLYRGADFITYSDIPEELRRGFLTYASALCKKIKDLGYRGILGLDAILADGNIYFLEVNNRFQGSSVLLNKALYAQGLPSLQQMNLDAFYGHSPSKDIRQSLMELPVPYSLYTFIDQPGNPHSDYLYYAVQHEKSVSEVFYEGYVPGQSVAPYATKFAVIFHTNITSLCDADRSVRLHPNISGASGAWNSRIIDGDWSAVKTAVINQGAVMTAVAKKFVSQHGSMREGTYFSLDLFIQGCYMNCPLYVKLAALSPFAIDTDSEGTSLCLKYYGNWISEISYDIKIPYESELLPSGVPIEQICFFATDRLRIQNCPFCMFARNGVPCRFCESVGIDRHFSRDDILAAIDAVFSSRSYPRFRHILVGGLSNEWGEEREVFLAICRRIRSYTADMPIYLMCLPPSADDIKAYAEAGVTEFGFNLEMFDRKLAEKYMPAKGRIPLDQYVRALSSATEYVGRSGAVRCAFIAGLEPMDSLLRGIEMVCSMGVAPILSVFRPIPGTEMAHIVPPSCEWLDELLERGEAICQKYNLTLGPACPACRNNTLSFVRPGEVEGIYSDIWKREP